MRQKTINATWLAALCVAAITSQAHAEVRLQVNAQPQARDSDLVWKVESPFRFFKNTASFERQAKAFAAVGGRADGPEPNHIVWRTERRLNDPDCKNMASPDTCAATAGKHWASSRLGWAAQTLEANCYDRKHLRYFTTCERHYSWGTAKEDYILPEAHTVQIALAPRRQAEVGAGECLWTWTPRRAGGKAESRKLPCKATLVIPRVPFSLNHAESGVRVSVRLPSGAVLTDPNVVVDDVFLVALGDSFASGESNPDHPVTFSPTRQMVYDPTLVREDVASLKEAAPEPKTQTRGMFSLSSAPKFDPKTLPMRRLPGEEQGLMYRHGSAQFRTAFARSGAQWLSPDCHRSQYGYPFRVGLQLALEDPHRSVTLVSLACSGAEIAQGLFLPMQSRSSMSAKTPPKVRPQFDLLSELICRGGAAAVTEQKVYPLPLYDVGSTQIHTERLVQRWCPPNRRKRPIDAVMMSIGGNDVGFGGLVVYSMTDSASDLAPIAGLIAGKIRFSPDVSRVYLGVLDERMKQVQLALKDGFGVPPSKVFQTAYEPVQYDENGQLCGADPTLGMDVHPKFALDRGRLKQTADFLQELQSRIQCIDDPRHGKSCPRLATGNGTGFNLITDHLSEFAKRGICARDPKRPFEDGQQMAVPRLWFGADYFRPYSPAAFLPYQHRWRLFRTPNDSFMTANVHSPSLSPFEILQPVFAGLYSGAVHPTAEGHAIVADHVVKHLRAALNK